jgi:glutamyl/glutaminyl-tRNA synthetase
VISRIAPTPSGFLHLGNALNFALTWLTVRRAGGKLLLRIDDLDATRTRTECIDDIFETLNWMKLDRDLGPRDAREFRESFSQGLRRERYLEAVRFLISSGKAYGCACSRAELERKACECRARGVCFEPDSGTGTAILNGAVKIDLAVVGSTVAGDPGTAEAREGCKRTVTLWRREDLPAYQLVSLIDDLDAGVDTIVRGEDLRESTAIQLALARELGDAFGASRFLQAHFIHHPLITGLSGEKLSKSRGADSLRETFRRDPSPGKLFQVLSPHLGFARPLASLREMLEESGINRSSGL